MRPLLIASLAALVLAGCAPTESAPAAGESMAGDMQKAQDQAGKDAGVASDRKSGRMNNRPPADGAPAPTPPPGAVGG